MRTAEAFARGLQRLRKAKGFTQAELAERAALSTQMVAALEQAGKTPSLATVDRVCEALGVRASQLFSAGELKNSTAVAPNERLNELVRTLPRREQEQLVDVVINLGKMLRRARKH